MILEAPGRAALALTVAGCLGAQQQQPSVVLKTTARLVQVSVLVHDRKGPVADLKKENFQIKVDGQVQRISVFSVESAGTLPAPQQKLPPNTFTNRLEERPGTPSSVTIILLDALNTKFADQAYARQQVIKYLETIQPNDHIGIYTLGNSLRVLHDYTTDSSELLRKLASYKGGSALPNTAGSHDPFGGDSLILDQWLRGGGASPAERSFYMANRIEGTLRAIEFIANHLTRVPGRKNLIWVSGGFPLTIGFENLAAWTNPAIEQRTFTDEVNRTVQALNNANVAIYPVDARGLMVDPRFDASRRGAPKLTAPRAPVGVRNQESMEELASRTGGRAYINTNDLNKAIRDAIADTQVTYTLGFYPTNEKYDGKFHEIKLQTPGRSGLNLRYRKGYFDLAEQPQDENARRAGLRDAVWSPIDASALGLTVEVTPARGSLEIYVKIDPTSIHLEPQGDRWQGRLDILTIQKDDRANQYNGQIETLDLNLLQQRYEQVTREGLVYKKVIERDRRANQVRVVVRDAASGSIGSVTALFSQLR